MKNIILSFVLLFCTSSLFAQEVFNPGIVKGKNVTYEVKEMDSYPNWFIRNINVPDTSLSEVFERNHSGGDDYIIDLEMQICEILHAHLSHEELMEINDKLDFMGIVFRVDSTKRKLLQVNCFVFHNMYARNLRRPVEERLSFDSYDEFWLNFDPDRLYAIERDIIEKVELPEGMPERYFKWDFWISVLPKYTLEKTRTLRQEAIERYKVHKGTKLLFTTHHPTVLKFKMIED